MPVFHQDIVIANQKWNPKILVFTVNPSSLTQLLHMLKALHSDFSCEGKRNQFSQGSCCTAKIKLTSLVEVYRKMCSSCAISVQQSNSVHLKNCKLLRTLALFLGISDSIEACVISSPNYLSAPHSELRLLLSLPSSRAQIDQCEYFNKSCDPSSEAKVLKFPIINLLESKA